jgi:hypothetical protein
LRSSDCLDCSGQLYTPTDHFIKETCKLEQRNNPYGDGKIYGYSVKDSLWINKNNGVKEFPIFEVVVENNLGQ